MNKFELFTLIFLALDDDWDETKNKDLGQFLSSANPFLFKEITSAVPAVYVDFCNFIGDTKIATQNSFELAHEYIHHVNIPAVEQSFSTLTREEWITAVGEYLSSEHKGSDMID